MVFSPVKQAAMVHDLRVLQPERVSDAAFCDLIEELDPDILVVVAFGQLLKRRLLDIPRFGALNIHGSLLPKYRGAAPIQWAVLNGDRSTGLSIMRLDEGMDTGPVLLTREVPIAPRDTAGTMHDRLAALSGGVLIETLEGLAAGRIHETPQDHSGATYAPKIDRSMSGVAWDLPAREVSAHIRGLDPWPGAVTTMQGKEVKLFSARVGAEDTPGTVPGRVAGCSGGGLTVETGRGVVHIGELQLAGKRRLPAGDFTKGCRLPEGTILGD